ncbi:MAG TPA: BatA domain-containing protein, partial [Planctomycetaceae bacterium]|nr:BatA domain-containing protein [Planctomycetaceae bacterium]
MTFLNLSILFGLIAVSIPIVIHLFNRRKANVVEWGAMRFLLGSLVNRRKRIQVEELILMGIRCLLISLLVLAVARPFTPVGSSLAWLALLPVLFFCVLAMALVTILTRSRARRLLAYAASTGAVLLAVYLSREQQLLHGDRWKNASSQDVAIVVDGSNSMRVQIDGQSNFERAVAEASLLTESLGPDDHVSILIAGGLIEVVTPEPRSARSNLDSVFESMQPVGGTMSVTDALSAAASALNAGNQAGKKIVLISDGQKLGWSEDNPGQWEFLADTFSRLPTTPPVVTRFLPLPDRFQNGAVSSLEVSRQIVGTDRPVTIRVSVENTGFEAIEPSGLQLTLDQSQVLVSEVGTIESGKTFQMNFEHRFERPGPHTIEARLMIEDDLAEDDRQVQLLHVLETLPVLLVDGSGRGGDSHSAASFVELALAPPADEEEGAAGTNQQGLVETTVIAAPDLSESIRFEDYRVVMLLDVPRLGAGVSAGMSRYVEQGGGLLIVPGNNCEPEFYNAWKTADGRPVLPSRLAQLIEFGDGDRATHPTPDSFSHPALSQLVSASQTDFGKAVVSTYWQLEAHPTLSGVRIGAAL